MAEKNPNKLYDNIKSMKANLESIQKIAEDLVSEAKETMNNANDFGGVIAKVFKEQMAKYLIPSVQSAIEPFGKLIDDTSTPGSMIGLTTFLDSVPLAMTRQEPTVTELASPVVPTNANIVNPQGTTNDPVDEIPEGASFNNPAPVQESKKRVKESLDDIFVDMKDSYYKLYEDLCNNIGEERVDKAILNNLKLSVFDIEAAIYDVAQNEGLIINYDDFRDKYGEGHFDESKIREADNYKEWLKDRFYDAMSNMMFKNFPEMNEDEFNECIDWFENHFFIDKPYDEEYLEAKIREAAEFVEPKDIFRAILEDTDNLKTGPTVSNNTKISNYGFTLDSQTSDFIVGYDPKTSWWEMSSTFFDDNSHDIHEEGEGWNNLIDAMFNDNEWFAYDENPKESYYIENFKSRGAKIRESIEKYQVLKSSKLGSGLDAEISKVKPCVVAEFDNKEEADAKAKMLNATITDSEKEYFGTEYKVEAKKFLGSKEDKKKSK